MSDLTEKLDGLADGFLSEGMRNSCDSVMEVIDEVKALEDAYEMALASLVVARKDLKEYTDTYYHPDKISKSTDDSESKINHHQA